MSDYIISKLILDTLLESEKISVIDCGARGGGERQWSSLTNNMILYGFDPDKDECDHLNEQAKNKGLDHFYYPLCLAENNDKNRDFYIAKCCDSSSLYPPNEELLKRFKQSVWGKTVYTFDSLKTDKIEKVSTTSLDIWAEENNIKEVDFIKLDVQGAELEVLKGGKKLLKSTLGLNIEVWFLPLYRGIPLFSDIDSFVRSEDFDFYSMHTYTSGQFVGRKSSPVMFDRVNTFWEQQLAGQLVTTDAFFLKDPIQRAIPSMDNNKILKLSCIAEISEQIEYAFELLSYLKKKLDVEGEDKKSRLVNDIYRIAAKKYGRKKKIIYLKKDLENRVFQPIKKMKKRFLG
ncbi:MAG: FkbM family methyltransferase [Deltaproteobacteria bacterium]|nr:FkbM family methyltransferase [Deltaproteobacteria bacterium]